MPYDNPPSIRSEYARKFQVFLRGGMLQQKNNSPKSLHWPCIYMLLLSNNHSVILKITEQKSSINLFPSTLNFSTLYELGTNWYTETKIWISAVPGVFGYLCT